MMIVVNEGEFSPGSLPAVPRGRWVFGIFGVHDLGATGQCLSGATHGMVAVGDSPPVAADCVAAPDYAKGVHLLLGNEHVLGSPRVLVHWWREGSSASEGVGTWTLARCWPVLTLEAILDAVCMLGMAERMSRGLVGWLVAGKLLCRGLSVRG